MNAFIRHVLGVSPSSISGGALGKVSAYYGCVEAQGRGSLHCHMMVWIKGALDPNAIRRRVTELHDEEFCRKLIAYLDNNISNFVPPCPIGEHQPSVHTSSRPHPCQTLGPAPIARNAERTIDLNKLVVACQTHRHNRTCYKYWKGPPDPKQCRFDLDPDNVQQESTIDEEGNVNLRCIEGMINNYNETILECVRCNMDIKFIASGRDAKAIMYYITDYVTKSPLSTHASYVALETAVKHLREGSRSVDATNGADRESRTKASSIVQRCAFSILGQQELSAQQVASELLNLDDHFTSHQFRHLFWLQGKSIVASHLRSRDPTNQSGVPPNVALANDDDDLYVSDDGPAGLGDIPSSETAEDETSVDVVLDISRDGQVFYTTGQLSDYLMRGTMLQGLCL
ncbi:hypothetical protein SISNIDRAFT_398553, partial [Sistotremastrum niveocremeum HHB9708]